MTTKPSMGSMEWIMLISLSVLWGGSFFFMKVSLIELPTLTIVVSRVVLASLTLFALMQLLGLRVPRDKDIWRIFFTMGLVNNVVPFCLLVWGMTEIASGLAAILNATTPVFTILAAHFFTRDERISIDKIAGILLGLFGVIVLIGIDLRSGFDATVIAMLACLGAAFSYGIAATYGRRFKALNILPVTGAFGQVTASSLLLLPIAMLVDTPWTIPLPGIHTWLSLIALGVLCTALAYLLYFRILSSAGATNISLVTLLVPVSAILLGWIILGESLAPNHFIGMGLITLGLLAIDGRLRSCLRIAMART